jgi:hypothetical protein
LVPPAALARREHQVLRSGMDADSIAQEVEGKIMSAFIRAKKSI